MAEFTAGAAVRGAALLANRYWRNLALQDGIALGFLGYLLLRALSAPEGPGLREAQFTTGALLGTMVLALALSRGEVFERRWARGLAYRFGLLVPILSSYFVMRTLMPALQPVLLDHQLETIDLALLGETPSLAWERYLRPATVEWFAAFYYLHWWMLGVMLIPALLRRPRDAAHRARHQELLAGALIVAVVGHTGYTLVPAMGPWATIHFETPIVGGFWWERVETTVAAAGAQLDVFPSLHTAYPTLFTLHAFGNRQSRVYRYLWPLFAFATVQIIIATMFLRWHWFIDVLAGLVLAGAARLSSVLMARREELSLRCREGRQAVWEDLWRSH